MSLTFPASPSVVSRARALARALDPELREDVEIVTSELVSNAIRHADTATVTVELLSTSEGVHVEVSDQDAAHLPHSVEPESTETSGRGLQIVACLCSHLHCTTGPAGKTVCADVTYSAAPAPAAEAPVAR
ncbi:ATP-binding protein [Streptomyces sp. NPDC049887]|uniref:ATP-binding protein n=1 Tax=Streptomyces sp. NPDC049887 TaxID=3155654 RepID=UPI0034323F77